MLQVSARKYRGWVASIALIVFLFFSSNCQYRSTEVISGTILGQSCEHGLIIEVDHKDPIGRRINIYRDYLPDEFAIRGNNAIAAVNETRFGDRKGEKIYFRYHPVDSIKQRVCPGWGVDTLRLSYVDIDVVDYSDKK